MLAWDWIVYLPGPMRCRTVCCWCIIAWFISHSHIDHKQISTFPQWSTRSASARALKSWGKCPLDRFQARALDQYPSNTCSLIPIDQHWLSSQDFFADGHRLDLAWSCTSTRCRRCTSCTYRATWRISYMWQFLPREAEHSHDRDVASKMLDPP